MASQTIYGVSERSRCVFKKHSFDSLMDNPLGVFLQVLENVLYVEDIKIYIHCMIESIGDQDIHKELGFMCSNDLTLNSRYVHLDGLNLVKYMFYTEFNNHDWT